MPKESSVTILCSHCNKQQIVYLQVTSSAQVSGQMVTCVKCQREFETPPLAKITAGPFAEA